MGKNIALLYMSAYFAQPAPEGSKNRFLRTQTNEAAVSALWKDPASRPDKIVALCSDTVRTKPTVPAADGSGNKVPTLEYFRDEFLKQLGVQQYRNQINHATDSAVKFQKDTGLLPLSTSAIEQTLGDVAFYLARLKDCKANAPVGIELLDSNKAF